ncbi:MAG: hypothetical protein M1820_001719 [Bogoriella megaspora]|nr:MAG: hypothetical protein M1820_001719 [Bogoriella megaspora]
MSSATIDRGSALLGAEYPRKANLREDVSRPLPKVVPGTVDPASMSGGAATVQVRAVLEEFNAALATNDVEKLAGCFYIEQAFWRDMVALTSHLRTFTTSRVVAAALLQTTVLRNLSDRIRLAGDAHFVVINPVMMFIDCGISFSTQSPSLDCSGKMVLLPVKADGAVSWKIWILSTWIEKLVQHPEDEKLLLAPGRKFDDGGAIETDVLIVGAGTSGLTTAARLKALGVESVILDRNARVGDSWACRYDCLRFHVLTSNCEMPYAYFKKELQSPHRLTKDDVADHLREYVNNFHLNVILSANIQSSVYSLSEKKWTIKLMTATGIGSGKPYLPPMEGLHLYKGISVHSAQYRNAQILAEQGVKSVAVIGSANTAFDVMQDCHKYGLKTTIVARSPTYIFPYDYLMDPHGIGAYDCMPLNAADKMLNTLPFALDGQFSHGLFGHLASKEPDRYLAISKAGFPVLDSRDPSVNIQHHLIERSGGHYIDVGGTELIADGKVSVRGQVEPVSYTETGLRLSDGSILDADAVVWCTGFADKDARATAREMLGNEETDTSPKERVLGPMDIAAQLDATWGVDSEGEVRGTWKRHLRMENYWVMGGNMQHQRWWSRPMVQQIRLALEGTLPPAYRETPSLN